MQKFAVLTVAGLLMLGCAPEITLAEYTPVVDTSKVSAAKFERDLGACRNIAIKAEAKYKESAQAQAQNQAIAGALVGALLGAAISDGGNNYAAEGALYGASAGVANASSENAEIMKYGPRRIVDRCMDERGYAILSDLGRG